MANIRETIREARLRWLRPVDRKAEDIVMRTLKMEVSGRKIGRPKQRCCYTKRDRGDRSTERRSTRPQNVEIENSMRRSQIGKRPKTNFSGFPQSWKSLKKSCHGNWANKNKVMEIEKIS